MGKTDIKDGTAVEYASPRDDEREGGSGQPAAARRSERDGGGSPLRIYKPGQGARVRWTSAIAGGALALWGVSWIFEQLGRIRGLSENIFVYYLIPVIVLAAAAVGLFYLIGRQHRVVDFLIATESEMKKVNWSTRREVLGATRVVIVMMLMLGVILFVADLFFMFFFERIGVLRTNLFGQLVSRLFGGGEG